MPTHRLSSLALRRPSLRAGSRVVLVLLPVLSCAALATAQVPARVANGRYVIQDSVVASGGSATAGRYHAQGEFGQAQTGIVQGGSYRLRAGFSHGAVGASGDRVFRDGFE